jgi:hypothetical protein
MPLSARTWLTTALFRNAWKDARADQIRKLDAQQERKYQDRVDGSMERRIDQRY